jgi:hypothetical protein
MVLQRELPFHRVSMMEFGPKGAWSPEADLWTISWCNGLRKPSVAILSPRCVVTNMCDFEGELRREPTQSRYSRLSRTNQVRRRSDQCEVVRIPVNPAAAACYVVGRGPSAEFGLRYGIIEIRLISLATKLGIQT